jgi:Raf kinase inhibitor-like YbhB/YbcL family protein
LGTLKSPGSRIGRIVPVGFDLWSGVREPAVDTANDQRVAHVERTARMSPAIVRMIGKALRGIRAGDRHLLWNDQAVADAPELMSLTSPAFAAGSIVPVRYAGIGVGENISPPLRWSDVPSGAAELVLVVQDPDAPLPRPVVHAIATGIAPHRDGLSEGELSPTAAPAIRLGRGSFGRLGYAGPRALPGHGPHRYVFQLVAVQRALAFEHPPTLAELSSAIRGCVMARGRLTAIFEQS